MSTIDQLDTLRTYEPFTSGSHIKAPDGWTRELDLQHYLDFVRFPGTNEEENWLERMRAVERNHEDLDTLLTAALAFLYRREGAMLLRLAAPKHHSNCPHCGQHCPAPLSLAAKIDLLRTSTNPTDHAWLRERLGWVVWALDESDRLVCQHLQKPGSVWLFELCELTDMLSDAGAALYHGLEYDLKGFSKHGLKSKWRRVLRWWFDQAV